MADFSCEECTPDSTVQRLQVRIELEGKVMADGGPVRLLPILGTGSDHVESIEQEVGESEASPEVDRPSTSTPGDGSDQPVGKSASGRSWSGTWFLIGSALLLLVAALVYRRSLANKRRAWRQLGWSPNMALHATEPLDPEMPHPATRMESNEELFPSTLRTKSSARSASSASEKGKKSTDSATLRRPIASKAVRLVVIRGSRQGKQYNVMVKGKAVVGTRSDSDCVLLDEPGVDPHQFELEFDGVKLYIRIYPRRTRRFSTVSRLQNRPR